MSAKRLWPGCMNAAGKLRQKWQATAGTKFTKPGWSLSAEPFSRSVMSQMQTEMAQNRDQAIR